MNDDQAPFSDYALVQLDRPVQGRKPLKLANAPSAENSRLSMIGYPLGMPAKYSRDGKILLDNPERQSFITNLDAFEGNSGSPVFNSSMEVVGILIAGTPSPSTIDFTVDGGKNTCERYNVCDENGESCEKSDPRYTSLPGFQRIGSEVQRIAPITDLIDGLRAR